MLLALAYSLLVVAARPQSREDLAEKTKNFGKPKIKRRPASEAEHRAKRDRLALVRSRFTNFSGLERGTDFRVEFGKVSFSFRCFLVETKHCWTGATRQECQLQVISRI